MNTLCPKELHEYDADSTIFIRRVWINCNTPDIDWFDLIIKVLRMTSFCEYLRKPSLTKGFNRLR